MERQTKNMNALKAPGDGPSELIIDPHVSHVVIGKLREFFLGLGFIEVHTQNRLSILAACEDPSTIATFTYLGQEWPLPQTGQMWLEYEYARNPNVPGYFCVTTSYREEKNPVPGRHLSIFPLFEFETSGGIDRLREIEMLLLEHLGYNPRSFRYGSYEETAKRLETQEITHVEENKIGAEETPVYFLEYFPERTFPFWNMKRCKDGSGNACKIDVLLSGQETFGSAERSCDVEDMRHRFYTIEDGEYKEKLFRHFGKERVEKELEEYLALFSDSSDPEEEFERCGGGIGVTRLGHSMRELDLLK